MTIRLRSLLVGAGGLSREWIHTVRGNPETEVAGLIDIRPGVAEERARDEGLHDVYVGTDLDDALRAVQPDVVIDITVPSAHRAVTVRSLEAGVPVLGEKPMSDSLDSARAMVEASERSGQLYMVSQSRRYDANLMALRGLVEDATGPLSILNSDFYRAHHMDAFRHGIEHVLLLDMGVHIFDAARYVSGQDAVAVYCEDYNPPWSWLKGMSSATALFEMTGGLRYTFRGSWCAEGRETSWESEWRAIGPHGTATWDGRATPVADVLVSPPGDQGENRRTVTRLGEPPIDTPQYFAGALDEFVRALRTNAVPWGECHNNIKTLAMACAAIESSVSGRRVSVTI